MITSRKNFMTIFIALHRQEKRNKKGKRKGKRHVFLKSHFIIEAILSPSDLNSAEFVEVLFWTLRLDVCGLDINDDMKMCDFEIAKQVIIEC